MDTKILLFCCILKGFEIMPRQNALESDSLPEGKNDGADPEGGGM